MNALDLHLVFLRHHIRLIENQSSVETGRNSIGVPGFLAGLSQAHSKYGSGVENIVCCDWLSLIWMVIPVANQVLASEHLVNATETKIHGSLDYPDFAVLK